MASFRDSANRTWYVVFTPNDLAKIKATSGVDIKAAAGTHVVRGVSGTSQTDFDAVVDLLFDHMPKQVQGYGLDRAGFRASVSGPYVNAALEAVRSALTELEASSPFPKTIRSNH